MLTRGTKKPSLEPPNCLPRGVERKLKPSTLGKVAHLQEPGEESLEEKSSLVQLEAETRQGQLTCAPTVTNSGCKGFP